ncbi:MAG: Crp/Fnr family transcriptional regulator [Hyphomicrobiaceae bacterium]
MFALQDISVPPAAGRQDRHRISDCAREECRNAACTTDICPILREVGKVRNFAKGDSMFWDGDDIDYLYIILSGVVRGSKVLSDGRRQICRFAFAGEVLEYCRRPHYPYTAEAITSVRVIAVPRYSLDRTMDHSPCVRRLLMRVVLDELQDARDQALALGRLSATEKVAYFLHTLARHLDKDDDGAFVVPMSRLDMADYLGLTIETVSRVISRLKRSGKIQLPSSNRIAINDLDEFAEDLLSDAA